MKRNNVNILRYILVIFIIMTFGSPLTSCGNKQEKKKTEVNEKDAKIEKKIPVNSFRTVPAQYKKVAINLFKNPIVKDATFGGQYKLIGVNLKKEDNGKTVLEFLFESLKEQVLTNTMVLTFFDKENKKLGKLFTELGKGDGKIKKGAFLVGSVVIHGKRYEEVKSFNISLIQTETPGLKIVGGKTDPSGEKLIVGF
jgi:hypothetical protein